MWTTKNLKAFTFRNGDPIPIIQDSDEWVMLQESAMCINPYSGEFYYNWYAVNDPRGLAPIGFHVPSDEEWKELVDCCGGEEVAGKMLKSSKKWSGTSTIKGFNAIPSGYRSEIGYFLVDYDGNWWSATPFGPYAWSWSMFTWFHDLGHTATNINFGLSVRLIKD